jgi:class I fructose-bisphosphate aldolase
MRIQEPRMSLGKTVRLNRLFSHPSSRLCSVAVDHWFGYRSQGAAIDLVDLPRTLASLMPAGPSAVTMSKGAAMSCWERYAGQVPLILQAGCFTPDDRVIETTTGPEECMRLGADAIAIAIGVRGPNEGKFLRMLSDGVTAAARYDLPVVAHIYPRDFVGGTAKINFRPEEIEWAVRCGIECGADVIKVGYTGDVASFRQIVAACPVPMVAAGGPKAATLGAALADMAAAVQAGARGATIGRNVWGQPKPTEALRAFKAVILDGATPAEALAANGLQERKHAGA